MEMKLALAMVLGSFEIEQVATAGGDQAREQLLFTMAPRGLLMRLQPRQPSPEPALQAAAASA
jgi:hypothetical protein